MLATYLFTYKIVQFVSFIQAAMNVNFKVSTKSLTRFDPRELKRNLKETILYVIRVIAKFLSLHCNVLEHWYNYCETDTVQISKFDKTDQQPEGLPLT